MNNQYIARSFSPLLTLCERSVYCSNTSFTKFSANTVTSAFKQHLYKSFEEEPGYFQFATAVTSNDLEEITKFLEDAVNGR